MENKIKSEKPNIIFIMSDDHASHAISAYTKNHKPTRPVINQTPNIDRIANEGLRCDNCFCTNSICAPSRAVILTGQHSHLNGVMTLSQKIDNRKMNFAKLLQQAGYQTSMIGKWHLGWQSGHTPTGFDYWNILPGQGLYKNPIFVSMGKKQRIKGYVTDLITDDALRWLEERETQKPFCMMVHHKAPHRPWNPDKKHAHMYENEDIPYPETFNDDYSNRSDAAVHAFMRIEDALNHSDIKTKSFFKKYLPIPVPEDISKFSLKTSGGKRMYFKSKQELKNWKYQRYIKDYLRCIASIDDNVGRILNYLDENNLAENTVIIYTSDQGFFLGDHGWFDKRFMYEESLRMPFVVRYPKEIPANSVNSDLLLNLDFAQTFLDYAGVETPEIKKMQGHSLRDVFKGSTPNQWRDGFYYRYWVNGTYHKVYAHYGIRTHQYKLIYYYCDPLGLKGAATDEHEPMWELFDLEKDPFEMNNVYTNPEYQSVVKELTEKLHHLQEECGDERYFKDQN